MRNPFAVRSPEILTPEDIAGLFDDVFSDFPKVLTVGHTFVHGARGTGKSMMLRYLEPEVQLAAEQVESINSLRYFGVYVPIRNSGLTITEWARLKGFSYSALAEHLMVVHITVKLFSALEKLCPPTSSGTIQRLCTRFSDLLSASGGDPRGIANLCSDDKLALQRLADICSDLFVQGNSYLGRLSMSPSGHFYEGPLCGYLEFLLPLAKEAVNLPFTPNGPLYFLVDDADELPIGMQKILNTWVSCRTTEHACLKISTQTAYATFQTNSGRLIETPHDYSEVDISTIYTSGTDNYYQRIHRITSKRLALCGIKTAPEDFFPQNKKQVEGIKKIKEEIASAWEQRKAEGKGGFRVSDDVTRYAIPEYIRRLGGTSKSISTYSYSGFKSIVDISSGIIRWFLESAATMYSIETSSSGGKQVYSISHNTQDRVLREWSTEFFVKDPEKMLQSLSNGEVSHPTKMDAVLVTQMLSLIDGIGKLFKAKLLDENASERRLISFLISDKPDEHLKEILALAVRLGYLQTGMIGAKEGLGGRKTRYVLSRRLAPYFSLDPGGYAAYLSITSRDLDLATKNADEFVRVRLKSPSDKTQPELAFVEAE